MLIKEAMPKEVTAAVRPELTSVPRQQQLLQQAEQRASMLASLEAIAKREDRDWAEFIRSIRAFVAHKRAELAALERWLGTQQ